MSLSPGEALAPALERAARALGTGHLRFRATSGVLDHAVLGFEDLDRNAYQSAEMSPAAVVCLDGRIEISGHDARALIAAVLKDPLGEQHSGRLLEANAGHALDVFIDGPNGTSGGHRKASAL